MFSNNFQNYEHYLLKAGDNTYLEPKAKLNIMYG